MADSAAPVRIGILGAARIAKLAVVDPAKGRGDVRLAAVAARDPERAAAYAVKFGFERSLGDYQALIDDPDIDAIYNALPPSRHADLTIAALEAGKAVLCEKPFAMNAAEARAMTDAAQRTGRLLMEGFHYRYHPMFAAVLAIVRSGELGTIRRIEAISEVPTPDGPGQIRYDPALGAGVLMDLGTYCVHLCRTLTGEEPRVAAAQSRLTSGGVDVRTTATLAFPGGVEAAITCSFEDGPRASLTVEGDDGRLVALNPLLPQYGNRLTVLAGGEERTQTFARDPTYGFQLAALVDAVRGGPAPPTSGADCVAQMTAIDAIRGAAARA
jgi:predicted dehydrogenase